MIWSRLKSVPHSYTLFPSITVIRYYMLQTYHTNPLICIDHRTKVEWEFVHRFIPVQTTYWHYMFIEQNIVYWNKAKAHCLIRYEMLWGQLFDKQSDSLVSNKSSDRIFCNDSERSRLCLKIRPDLDSAWQISHFWRVLWQNLTINRFSIFKLLSFCGNNPMILIISGYEIIFILRVEGRICPWIQYDRIFLYHKVFKVRKWSSSR